MDAKNNLFKLQMECYEVFKAQNPENDVFDVIFEIDGKKLYADKFRLSAISPTFKSMLSDRWNSNKNDSIKIKDYKYEEFKEFLIFIYSGTCNITDSNIFLMLDMAEFYGVEVFKEECEEYLSKMKLSNQNIFQLLEAAEKYSMAQLQELLKKFVTKNFESFAKAEKFHEMQKSTLKNIVKDYNNLLYSDILLEAVFKWAENRVLKTQKIDENIILNYAIKEELSDILPAFKFEEINVGFLIKFFVNKSFLFPENKFGQILLSAYGKVHVKITNSIGKVMKGILNCPETNKVSDVIQSQKNVLRKCYWPTNQIKPSEPSKLIKNDDIKWYLVYDKDEDVALRQTCHIHNNKDYLLAEMVAENGFELGYDLKIVISRCT